MPVKIKKAYICSSFNGCMLSSYLLTRIRNFLAGNGVEISDEPDKSDIVIIGTCANIGQDEKKAKDLVDNYLGRYKGRKRIIVTGCLPDISPGFFRNRPELMPIGAKRIDELNSVFKARKPISGFYPNIIDEQYCLDEDVQDVSHYQYYSPEKYYIEISRGCLNNCSYCAIKKAKGALKSRTVDCLVKQLRSGVESGYKKIVLMGDECGGYGRDIGSSFVELLRGFSRVRGDFEIFISNIEPSRLADMKPYLKSILGKIRISYINLPLQHGNDRMLKLMNRRYRARDIIKLVRLIRKFSPATKIETHFIYGFPSETRKEFLDSITMSRYFDTVSFFIYSKRSGTAAASLKGAVSRGEMSYRTAYIKKLRMSEPKKYYFADMKIFPQYAIRATARTG